MLELPKLHAGLKGTAALLVGVEHTAPRIGSGLFFVLATSAMTNLMEAAARAAVEEMLPAGYQCLGTHFDVRHLAATPVEMHVRALAELIAIDGRRLSFRVEVRDEKEVIGEGMHQRTVVNVDRFDERVQKNWIVWVRT